MNKNILIAIIGLAILAGGYFLLRGGYQQAPQESGTQSPSLKVPAPGFESVPEAVVNPDGEESESADETVKEITVSGSEFLFNPSAITLKAGERVKVNFKNNGKVIHNWSIEKQGIGTQIIPGGAGDAVEFTAPAVGTYTFFCSVPGHRERGMVGNLIVD